MSRGLTSADLTELGSGSFEFAWLIKFDFSTPLYYTTFARDIEYDGNTYESTSLITKIPKITESLKIKPSTTSINLSGASEVLHALFLTEDYRNSEVTIYLHLPGTGNTITMFKGFCSNHEATEDVRAGKSNIQLKIANHWTNWEAVEGRFITHANQQKLYPSDMGLEYAFQTDYAVKKWGRTKKLLEAWVKGVGDRAVSIQSEPLEGFRLPIVYGQNTVKGIPVFRSVTGTNNKYLWVVYALAEGECDSLVDVYFDEKSYTESPLSGKINNISNNFHSGSTTQTVDTDLDTDSTLWTSSHTLNGICYCAIRYTRSDKVWGNSEPDPTFEIKGRKLYDPRDGTTAYSTNPALVLYDYLTSTDYGKAIDSSDLSNFDVVADYCETQKTDHDAAEGGIPASINLFDFNGVIDTKNSIKQNVEKILFSMRAYLPWVNGKYKLISETESDTSVYSFNEDNIVLFSMGDAEIRKRANEVYVTIQDKDLNYKSNQVIESSATFLAEDNNRVLKKTINLPFETNRYRAQNRAATLLKQSRQDVFANLTAANSDCLEIECGDIVDITRSLKGWTSKNFRVGELTIDNNLNVDLKTVEYEGSVFDWAVSVETPSPDNTEIRDVFTVAAPTAVTVATGTQRTAEDGTTIDRGKITWTWPADEFVEKCLVQVKETNDAATEYTTLGEVDVDDDYIQYFDAKVGATYIARVLGINDLKKRSSWASSSTHKITGSALIGATTDVVRTDTYNSSSMYWSPSFDSLDGIYYYGDVTLNSSASENNTVTIKGNYPSGTALIWQDTSSETQPPLGWSYKRRLFAVISNASMSTLPAGDAIRFGLGSTMVSRASNTCGFDLRYNSGNIEYECWTYGSSGSSSGWTTLPSGAVKYEIIIDPATSVEFKVDGSSVFTETTSTYIPSGSDYANGSRFKLGIHHEDNAGTPSAAEITLHKWEFLQEP